jgi:hypothetical protein
MIASQLGLAADSAETQKIDTIVAAAGLKSNGVPTLAVLVVKPGRVLF